MSLRSTRAKTPRLNFNDYWRWLVPRPRMNRRASLWTMAGGVVCSTILFWVMVQLGQASSDPKQKTSPTPQSSVQQVERPALAQGEGSEASTDDGAKALAPPATQGPSIDMPREVLEMLDQRKRDLDRREEAIHQNEERLMIVRSRIEELLEQNEALEKRIQNALAKEERPTPQQAKLHADKDRVAQDQRMQLAKIFEAMPSEDAAARLERMPDRKAIEILRLVKSKTAGAILSQVKPDRAAKLTEQLLAQMP